MVDLLKLSAEFSPKLGVRDLPKLDKNHQSNVPGLFIVGDLADAPIIKVALKQGHDVAQHIASTLQRSADPSVLDVVVIGAGPAGIGAGLALQDSGLQFVLYEREVPFSTIQNFPKGKQIFAEPISIDNPTGFWFDDAAKEDLVERWGAALEGHSLPIEQPVEVVDAQRRDGGFEITLKTGETTRQVRAQRIILACGKRGQPNRLGIPGEALPHVHSALKDGGLHSGEAAMVIGGGDTAVETAIDLAENGAKVVISYRGTSFHRVKRRNQDRIEALQSAGQIDIRFESQVKEISPHAATISRDGQSEDIPTDVVFTMIGSRLPLALLRRLGVRMQGEMSPGAAVWIASFATITYGFYCLKSKKELFPFGEQDPLGWMHAALQVDLGFRTVDASFWGTCVYALVVLVFGIRAYRKYPSVLQKRRYLSLIAFQWVFLFGVPELIAPLIIDRPWKLYALSVPWPLSIWSLVDAPAWNDGNTATAIGWLALGAFTSFVAIPLYVRRNGERFCSYMCGCGGLAETLGDFWRHLAPRGQTAEEAERIGRFVLLLAIPVTLLILNDAWGFFAADALYSTTAFAQHWYGLMVDFWLASVLGVAAYPYLGNRVWCRFFCPLRAYMEELARRFSRIQIRSNDKCIGCGECTRYCQMGIPVQTFAQKQVILDNTNSACIQCGICVEVCPMDVLEVGLADSAVRLNAGAGPL